MRTTPSKKVVIIVCPIRLAKGLWTNQTWLLVSKNLPKPDTTGLWLVLCECCLRTTVKCCPVRKARVVNFISLDGYIGYGSMRISIVLTGSLTAADLSDYYSWTLKSFPVSKYMVCVDKQIFPPPWVMKLRRQRRAIMEIEIAGQTVQVIN